MIFHIASLFTSADCFALDEAPRFFCRRIRAPVARDGFRVERDRRSPSNAKPAPFASLASLGEQHVRGVLGRPTAFAMSHHSLFLELKFSIGNLLPTV